MSKVDWGKAPNWAKGYWVIGIAQYAVWFDDYFYEYIASGKKHEFDDGCTFKKSDFSYTVERPKQPQSWSGPEDGLPPVGTVCEFMSTQRDGPHEFEEVKIMYLSEVTVVARRREKGSRYTEELLCHPITAKFRPVRTPEQLAASVRESAIRDVMDIAQVDCRVTAARLVDAGFKREGV